MSKENKFCVEIAAKLFPFIDLDRDNRIMTDDPASKDSIPDLELFLRGAKQPIRMEVKWMTKPESTQVKVQAKQIRSWVPGGVLTPHLWLAERATKARNRFFIIEASEMEPRLSVCRNALPPPPLWGSGEVETAEKVALPGTGVTEPEFWSIFWRHIATGAYLHE